MKFELRRSSNLWVSKGGKRLIYLYDPKTNLNFNEFVFRCPHCNVELLRVVEVMVKGDIKMTKDLCPECYGEI